MLGCMMLVLAAHAAARFTHDISAPPVGGGASLQLHPSVPEPPRCDATFPLRLRGGADKVRVRFEVRAEHTRPGDVVLLLGSGTALGDWKKAAASSLITSKELFPLWRVDVDIDVGNAVEYKYAVRSASGVWLWEPGENRKMVVPDTVMHTVEASFGDNAVEDLVDAIEVEDPTASSTALPPTVVNKGAGHADATAATSSSSTALQSESSQAPAGDDTSSSPPRGERIMRSETEGGEGKPSVRSPTAAGRRLVTRRVPSEVFTHSTGPPLQPSEMTSTRAGSFEIPYQPLSQPPPPHRPTPPPSPHRLPERSLSDLEIQKASALAFSSAGGRASSAGGFAGAASLIADDVVCVVCDGAEGGCRVCNVSEETDDCSEAQTQLVSVEKSGRDRDSSLQQTVECSESGHVTAKAGDNEVAVAEHSEEGKRLRGSNDQTAETLQAVSGPAGQETHTSLSRRAVTDAQGSREAARGGGEGDREISEHLRSLKASQRHVAEAMVSITEKMAGAERTVEKLSPPSKLMCSDGKGATPPTPPLPAPDAIVQALRELEHRLMTRFAEEVAEKSENIQKQIAEAAALEGQKMSAGLTELASELQGKVSGLEERLQAQQRGVDALHGLLVNQTGKQSDQDAAGLRVMEAKLAEYKALLAETSEEQDRVRQGLQRQVAEQRAEIDRLRLEKTLTGDLRKAKDEAQAAAAHAAAEVGALRQQLQSMEADRAARVAGFGFSGGQAHRGIAQGSGGARDRARGNSSTIAFGHKTGHGAAHRVAHRSEPGAEPRTAQRVEQAAGGKDAEEDEDAIIRRVEAKAQQVAASTTRTVRGSQKRVPEEPAGGDREREGRLQLETEVSKPAWDTPTKTTSGQDRADVNGRALAGHGPVPAAAMSSRMNNDALRTQAHRRPFR